MTTAKLSCATTKIAIPGEQPVSRLPVEAFVATRAQNFAVERQARLVPDAIFKVKFGDGPAGVEAALLEASQDAVERFQGRELGASPGPAPKDTSIGVDGVGSTTGYVRNDDSAEP